ncbi:hypothetical protein TRFO_22638 [Tritrichomonas foetus]|uniref:Uncharacterized protein n=1 Tax=Tritrichomonas foetus TaxID=1144522 RepID=A0A1J4KG78_9EUKA|nr:hypothetical protein TRFO_22638 [Tritrichomonas foetus]|eukprot:OHT08788.1 hypothetical protein TRFO_22638 [Tritrichomonas foetus]
MLFVFALLTLIQSSTETFLEEYNRIDKLEAKTLHESDFNRNFLSGHYRLSGNSVSATLKFAKFSILEVDVAASDISVEGPVYVKISGANIKVNVIGNGFGFPFIESTATNINIACTAHNKVPTCVLQTYSCFIDSGDHGKVTYYEKIYIPMEYTNGDLNYLCGFQDVDIMQLKQFQSSFADPRMLVLQLASDTGRFCTGDGGPSGAGSEIFHEEVDRLTALPVNRLPQVGHKDKYEAKLTSGNYQIYVDDSDLHFTAEEPCILEIINKSRHFKAYLKGPIYVKGSAKTADFTTEIDASNIALPFFDIEGEEFTLYMKRTGKTSKDHFMLLGKTEMRKWKISTDRGVDSEQGGMGNNRVGYALSFKNVGYNALIGNDDELRKLWIGVMQEKIPPNAALIVGFVSAFFVLIVVGVIVGVVVYCFVIKPKRQNQGGNANANDQGATNL